MIGQIWNSWRKWIGLQIKYYTERNIGQTEEEIMARIEKDEKDRRLKTSAVLAAFAYHDLAGEYPDFVTDEIKELCETIRKDIVK
ncbi:MAG: hypothetical protein ABIJ57_15765 [Pseudomonadota bacterium]